MRHGLAVRHDWNAKDVGCSVRHLVLISCIYVFACDARRMRNGFAEILLKTPHLGANSGLGGGWCKFDVHPTHKMMHNT